MTQNSPSTAAPAPSLSRRSLLVSGVCTAAVPAALAVGASPASARPVGTSQGVPTVGGSSHLPTGAGGAAPSIEPGEPWTDTNGSVIQAHGGQVVIHEDDQGTIYYWYGEDRSNGYGNSPGVHVYSSRNLSDWDDEGLALRALEGPAQLDSDPYFTALYAGYDEAQREAVIRDLVTFTDEDSEETVAILERPKVLYNEATDTWVMWVHADGPSESSDAQYAKARAGVAVSESPTGPFRWIDSYRLHVAPEGEENYDPDNPGMARDMTLFKDDDGTAYIIYSSEENYSLFISKLDAEYTYLATGPDDAVKGVDFTRPYIGAHREAPALFKRGQIYYLITSGATGWDPNPASWATSTEILGEWTDHGNPCVGDGAEITFGSQSTNVIPVDPERGVYVYMGDRWTPEDLANSPYVWLPVRFGEGTEIALEWHDSWNVEDLPPQPRFEVDARMPDAIRPGAEHLLPTQVELDRDGEVSTQPVGWDGDLERPGLTTVVGRIGDGDEGLTFRRQVLVVPRRIEYVVSAGGESTSDYRALREHSRGTVANSVPDQEYGQDPQTGRTWGFTGDSDAAGSGIDSMDRTVRYAQGGADLRYRFDGLDSGRYRLHLCFYEPWPETEGRTAQVILNDEVIVAEQSFDVEPTVVAHPFRLGREETVDLVVSPTADPDVQISWILIERM